ncbi:MAG: hypothetical protein UU14_C0029G0022, partial [Candidatus Roizmanbacteria bacterium GW2011_GWB1_40_7]
MHMNLATPISQIPGIGPVYVKRLEKLNIFNVKDLLEAGGLEITT